MVKSNRRRDEERRTAAAAKVAEMQRAQQAAERRRRSIIVSAGVVAVVVVIVGIFVLVQLGSQGPSVSAHTVGGTTSGYGFVVGKADAPATLVAYEDFQCPVCDNYEKIDGPTVEKYLQEGKLRVEYRPVAILDRESSTNYSTRALNAAACVRNFGTAAEFLTFHDLLYANQPAEGSAGLPNSQLITYANQAMKTTKPSVATCINDETYKNWTSSATDAFSKGGYTGTPTLILNGKELELTQVQTSADMIKLLNAAVAQGSKTK
jgi:protein-disulfide isomerase